MANQNNQIQNVTVEATEAQKKQSAFKRAGDAAFRKWQNFKTSKVGRWTLRLTKAVLVGGACYGAYKEGQKSVKPTTIYIQTETGEVVQPENQEPVQEEPVQAENA